jgi:hypothetical protein
MPPLREVPLISGILPSQVRNSTPHYYNEIVPDVAGFISSSWSGKMFMPCKRRIKEIEQEENATVISRDYFGPRTAKLR